MRLVCVVQARQGSSRFPGKSLRPLAGRPMIAHVLERAKTFCPHVVLATSSLPRDDELTRVVMGLRLGVPVVRGSEADVLDRVWRAAALASATTVVRVTGDCPLLAPDVAFAALLLHAQTSARYTWNDTARSGYPDGTDVEVFSREALEDAWAHATEPADREHVTPWIRRAGGVAVLRAREDWSRLKLSVDRPEDLERVQRICARLPARAYTLEDTLRAAREAGEL